MALIPNFFLDCVVAIGFADSTGSVAYAGTGFLIGRPRGIDTSTGAATYSLFLATNRHVLEGSSHAFLRFNPEAPHPAKVFPAQLVDHTAAPLWSAHPNPKIDVAVIGMNAELLKREGIKFHFFAEDKHLLTLVDAKPAGTSEGDGVFVLGFPMGNVGAERNYVVVRQGAIARIGDTLSGAVDTFLMDATVFPGNSGGPVVTRPEIHSIAGTQSVGKASLLGVVSAYLPYQDIAVSQQTKRPRIIFEENSGLTTVIPIHRVLEAIDALDSRQSSGVTSEPKEEHSQGLTAES